MIPQKWLGSPKSWLRERGSESLRTVTVHPPFLKAVRCGARSAGGTFHLDGVGLGEGRLRRGEWGQQEGKRGRWLGSLGRLGPTRSSLTPEKMLKPSKCTPNPTAPTSHRDSANVQGSHQ